MKSLELFFSVGKDRNISEGENRNLTRGESQRFSRLKNWRKVDRTKRSINQRLIKFLFPAEKKIPTWQTTRARRKKIGTFFLSLSFSRNVLIDRLARSWTIERARSKVRNFRARSGNSMKNPELFESCCSRTRKLEHTVDTGAARERVTRGKSFPARREKRSRPVRDGPSVFPLIEWNPAKQGGKGEGGRGR